MPKQRLDVLLVERGLAASRSLAQSLIMAGQVRVDGQVVLKPATNFNHNVTLEIDKGSPYVSRGGEKLAAALQAFGLQVNGFICADIGASTGGFTDCMLQNGAARVYAIDVGKGILHWKLRNDRRVVVMEETNARYLETLPEPLDLVTIDASFISLKILFPVVRKWLETQPTSRTQNLIALIKPQFEVGKQAAARGKGVIRNASLHLQVITEVLEYAQREGLRGERLIKSPLLGPKGNTEFLSWMTFSAGAANPLLEEDLDALFKQAQPGEDAEKPLSD